MRLREFLAQSWRRTGLDGPAVLIVLSTTVLVLVFRMYGSVAAWKKHFAPAFPDLWGGPTVVPYLYWFTCCFVLLALVPMLLIALHPRLRLRDFGLGLGDWRAGLKLYALLTAGMVPVLAFAATQRSFQTYYPMSSGAATAFESFALEGDTQALAVFLVYELMYCVYFVGWEFVFRGYMTHGLHPAMGSYAVLVSTIPFSLLHVGKPPLETFASVPAGLLLGYVALRTRSMWWGWLLHVTVAMSMDLVALAMRFR
jgi:uncharacterized protein